MVLGYFQDDFDDSFTCSGINPLTISENGKKEVQADIQISSELVKRLENDDETSIENITILKRELEHES
jgi:hypothetical protein